MEDTISLRELLQHFEDATQNTNYCFIIGSGASFSSGIPTGSELVKEWLIELYSTETKDNEIQDDELENWIRSKPGFEKFSWEKKGEYYSKVYQLRYLPEIDPATGESALRARMKGLCPGYGYSVLARILAYTKHRIVLTTNFDHLIENSLHRYANVIPQVITSDGQSNYALTEKDDGPPVIIKVHGDTYFATKNTEEGINNLSGLWSGALKKVFMRYTPVVIGYGGNDNGFMNILADLKRNFFQHPPLWCYYVRDRRPDNQLIDKFIKKQNGRYVPVPDFDEFMLLFSRIFNLNELEEEQRREQENHRAAWRRDFEYLSDNIAKREPNDELIDEPTYRFALSKAIKDVVGTNSRSKDWWQWHYRIRIEEDEAKKEQYFREGIKVVYAPEPLEAGYARYLYSKNRDKQKNILKAKNAYRTAKNKYGHDHPDTLSTEQQLARILDEDNQNDEAKRHYEIVLVGREQTLGRHHPDTIASRRNLSKFFLKMNKYRDAQLYIEDALATQRKFYGDHHWLTQELEKDRREIKGFLTGRATDSASILMIHQPHFFPWLGYFNKLLNCTHFVVLDNVQFRKNYFQNRTKIYSKQHSVGWLTIPVHSSIHKKINQIVVSDPKWRDNILRMVKREYAETYHFEEVISFLENILKTDSEKLVDITSSTLQATVDRLGFSNIVFKRASDLTGASDRTERIIEICDAMNIYRVIFGEGGVWHAHDLDRIKNAGIRTDPQDFANHHPRYRQFEAKFIPNLSILDALFHCGFVNTVNLIRNAWTPQNEPSG